MDSSNKAELHYKNVPDRVQDKVKEVYWESVLHEDLLGLLDFALLSAKECKVAPTLNYLQDFSTLLQRRASWPDMKPGARKEQLRRLESEIKQEVHVALVDAIRSNCPCMK